MSPVKWNAYNPPERMTIERAGESAMKAEILWTKRFASNATVNYEVRATVSDEAGKPLFYVVSTRGTPDEPEGIAAVRRKVEDLVKTNSWRQDETYLADVS
jgi:hypothetical protein